MHEKIWAKCMESIGSKIPEQSFKTWFKPIVPIKFSLPVLTIQVPSQFFYEWLEDNYVQILKEAIQGEIGSEGKLEYSVIVDKGNSTNQPYTVNLAQKKGSSKFGQNKGDQKQYSSNPFEVQTVQGIYQNSNLNLEHTFDTYIVHDNTPLRL
jgi:chromosomal replication initiator protein